MNGLEQAIEIAGGIPQLARLCGYDYDSRIRNWRKRGGAVPGKEVRKVRRAVDYRVSAESLLEPVDSDHPV